MSFKSLVTPNLEFRVLAGNCLAMAQGIVGAPVRHNSATDAANATTHRHANRDIPNAVTVLWFDHWGSYGQPGREVYANWGHVVVYVPGYGFASSSPYGGEVSTPYYYSSITEVEQAFNCTFRFWTEDINGTRVNAPANIAAHTAANRSWEDDMHPFNWNADRKSAQKIQPNKPTRIIQNDEGAVTVAKGPGDLVGVTSSVRIKGKPGARVEVRLIIENGDNKELAELGFAREVFDDLGLASLNVTGSGPVKRGEYLRTIVHTSAGAGVATVEKNIGNGYARPGV